MGTNFIQKIIDKIRKKYPQSYGYRLMLMKKCGIEKNLLNIENLIIGSSHGECGYYPDKNEFNLCIASQDLYYSYKLYEKYAEKLPKLKNLIVFYSVFSPGFDMVLTSQFLMASGYYKVFGILPPYENKIEPIQDDLEQHKGAIKRLELFTRTPKNYYGQCLDRKRFSTLFKPQDLESRTKSHLKNNQREVSQNVYLEKIIELAKCHNIKLTVVIAPAKKEYKDLLPDYQTLFKGLFDLQSKYGFKVINSYIEDNIDDEMWFDYDHLNPFEEGAKEYTKKIRSML